MRGLGVAALMCTALYALGRETAVLGAILLTAYMGVYGLPRICASAIR